MKTDISLKFYDIYSSCNAFVQKVLGVYGNLRSTVLMVAGAVMDNKISADIILGQEHVGTLPLWPNLWRVPKTFLFTTMLLMFRQNRGKQYDASHLRVVFAKTDQAFENVLFEILWQIIHWLEEHGCAKRGIIFDNQIIRFHDVLQNYLTACFAKMNLTRQELKAQAERKWPDII